MPLCQFNTYFCLLFDIFMLLIVELYDECKMSVELLSMLNNHIAFHLQIYAFIFTYCRYC